ncbi:MAG: VOC family protein [Chloroflexota bacterium]
MTKKQQFNVYLSPDLIERVKAHSTESQQSLSGIAEAALRQYLESPGQSALAQTAIPAPMRSDMSIMVLVFANDIDSSIVFYQMLGLDLTLRSKSGGWAELELGDAILALHRMQERRVRVEYPAIDLCFVTHIPLEILVDRFRRLDVTIVRDILDEGFGRTLVISDPDGNIISINENDQVTENYIFYRASHR